MLGGIRVLQDEFALLLNSCSIIAWSVLPVRIHGIMPPQGRFPYIKVDPSQPPFRGLIGFGADLDFAETLKFNLEVRN